VEITGPAGFKLRTHGPWVYVTLIVLLAFGFVGFLVWQHDNARNLMEQRLLSNQKDMVEAQEATTYVLTLPQEERDKLKLRMPQRLRDRVQR